MLNVKELFKFAILLEQNGCTFYRHAVRVTDNVDAKVIFEFIADEELKHQQRFEAMQNQSKDVPLNEADGDVSLLLRSSISNIILSTGDFKAELAAVRDLRGALKFALQRESDSLLYYGEIKKFVPAPLHRTLDGIIQEEGRHYAKLTDLLQSI